jgi:putative colanic acid biosynthesis acetyltransferase WcaF
VASSAIIKMPWHVTLEDRAAIGDGAELYSLGHITLRERCTVAQHSYLCTGTHDLSHPDLPLVVGEIDVGREVFIGVRALVLPGVILGEGSVVGAGSVVTRDVQPWDIVAGNPARVIGRRQFGDASAGPSAGAAAPTVPSATAGSPAPR